MIDPSSRAPDSSLSRRIRRMVALDPGATALFFGGLTFPWSFYSDALADLETLLAAHPEARRIGIVLRNRPGPLVALVATLGTGREVVTLSPHLGDIGLEQDIVELAPDVVVAEDEDWARDAVLVSAQTVGAIALRTGADRALAAQPVPWSPRPSLQDTRDIAVLMMTSGTTGRPKRVELTYERMTAAFRAAGLVFDEVHKPRLHSRTDILWASLAHISGLYFAVAHAVEGRSIALLERFEVAAWVGAGQACTAPATSGSRRPRCGWCCRPRSRRRRSPASARSGPAPRRCRRNWRRRSRQRYGIPVLGTYGATEFAGAIAGWTLKDKKQWGPLKRGSVGRAHHGIELRVVDADSGDVLPAGQTGLLEARGGQLPGAEGAWLRTTDLATIDDDLFLFIRGRADEAINRGGFKIPPSVIEDALAAHPAVDEASAVGLPDARLGQVPAAAVTLLSPATEEELMQYLTGLLTRYQRPVAIKVVDQLPRTPSLKISRALVREHYFDGFNLDGQLDAEVVADSVADAATTGESHDH